MPDGGAAISDSFGTGHINQYFNPRGQAFHEEVALNYGSVVKLDGMFGVSPHVMTSRDVMDSDAMRIEQTILRGGSQSIAYDPHQRGEYLGGARCILSVSG